jgi:hypothetical protein
MTNTGNKVYNIFINSANRSSTDKSYDFSVFFDNDEILVNNNEGVNVNIASFSLLNSMYNVNRHTKKKTFLLHNDFLNIDTNITIPYGNYNLNVYTLLNQLNILLTGKINISYNVATNTYTHKNLAIIAYSILVIPLNCSQLLGLSETTSISVIGTISSYVNMVNYQQVVLRCPTLVFESNSLDNIQDKNNFIAVSDILYWINKQDVEPFKTINFKMMIVVLFSVVM